MPLPEGLTNLPPKRLALIAGGGVGAGLLWRYLSKRKTTTTQVDANGNAIDVSKLALAENSAGNLAATQPVPNPNDAARSFDTGSFPLPVQKGIVTGSDGIDYLIDAAGHVLGPLNPSAAPGVPPVVSGTPGAGASGNSPGAGVPFHGATWTQSMHDWYDKLATQFPTSGYDSNLNVGDTIPTDYNNPYYYTYEAASSVAQRGFI